VALMDIRMPELDGIAATERLTTAGCAARGTGVLTTFDLDEYVHGALRAGASGFLLKDAPPVDLHSAIRIVAAGDALLAPQVTRRLIAAFIGGTATHTTSELDVLTDRERQVLALVAEGLTNAEIGERLFIAPGTAKVHVARLLYKLGARDRVQLVIIAHRARLVARP
jgi:DNA-binding NarL/FixJ family response regulator